MSMHIVMRDNIAKGRKALEALTANLNLFLCAAYPLVPRATVYGLTDAVFDFLDTDNIRQLEALKVKEMEAIPTHPPMDQMVRDLADLQVRRAQCQEQFDALLALPDDFDGPRTYMLAVGRTLMESMLSEMDRRIARAQFAIDKAAAEDKSSTEPSL